MAIGFVFPGQGSQVVGMGKDLVEFSSAAADVFKSADQALGESLSEACFNGPAETLTLTANTQPAVLTVSIAALSAFREKCGIQPSMVAGHSLGEYSALVAADAMDFMDAVKVTRARGSFMQDAVPAGQGSMSAILGSTLEVVQDACEKAAQDQIVAPANLNAPGQTVISGHSEAVERAGGIIRERGGAKVVPLKVSAPFHCALMQPTAEQLAGVLNEVEFRIPKMPVVCNVNARAETEPEKLRQMLVDQVTSPVRWEQSIRFMVKNGIDYFIEFGPGRVLAGLIKRIAKGVPVTSVGDVKSLEKTVSEFC